MRVTVVFLLVLAYALYSAIDTEYLTEYQTKTTAHVVQSGDTLSGIAEKHYRSDSNVVMPTWKVSAMKTALQSEVDVSICSQARLSILPNAFRLSNKPPI